ncbi:uncharacterized protein BYT42DRAFT_552217 [Radiomyces spectabilis]|uniref:uncharacterized protein n=1 Tax=Radiomyces spectabilis TaxID=64574 RepID=UPI0022201E5E|nr:uncharacterized protein BYT42DRAFT_552217 [Radiomyces spectabilis]KAI8393779.1 hypothetical protein BYT42DRAFT_552217 [Radiomyces spectabilis]
MVNLYMVYGGTNCGMLGDPDVYTSYDYSACIREHGYMSSRGRLLRQTILFARSFDPYFTKTDLVQHASVKTSIPHVLNRQRVAVGADQAVEFNFFRNFDRKKRDNFEVSVRYNDQAFSLGCHLPYKTSFIGIGNYQTANGLHLIVSTVPILARMLHPNGNDEVWVVEPNEIGAMAFMKKALSMTGNMQNDVWRQEGQVMILTFEKTNGWTKLATTTGNLYLVGLTGEDAKTLYAEFQEPYWNQGVKRSPAFLAWGADDMFYNPHDKHLEVNYHPSNRNLQVLSFDTSTDRRLLHNFKGVYEQLPLVRTADLKQHAHQQFPLPIVVSLSHWEARPVYFEKLPWQPLMHRPHDGRLTWDSLDYHFTSGHTVYQTTFLTPSQQQPKVKLSLNARHRSTVILNGRIVGGHTTYSRQLFAPGAKIGPDPWFLGSHTYDLSPYLSREGRLENQLVILVSNFGLHRQAFVMDDVRNPHGIIKATLSGLSHNETQRAQDAWQIAGVDVRKLDNPFNTVGVPDERATLPWTQCNGVQQEKSMYRFPVLLDDGARWMRFRFDHGLKSASASFNIPLRLHLEGQWTGYIYLNDHLMARYYGNGDSPQHDFYIPEGWVQRRKNEVKMLVYTWHDTEPEISIAGWPIDMETGNLLKDHESGQKEYMVWKDQFHVI